MDNSAHKHPKAIYEPGELDKVRQKLGPIDKEEAQRMVSLLGGEVGIERSKQEDPTKERIKRNLAKTKSSLSNYPETKQKKPIEILGNNDSQAKGSIRGVLLPTMIKISYHDRIAMDALMAQKQYQIKTSTQAFISKLAFFGEPVDKLNPNFIIDILPEYCTHIEKLVFATKKLLPKRMSDEPEPLQDESPLSFQILSLIRDWKIKPLISELMILQKNARNMGFLQMKTIVRLIHTIPMRLNYISDGIITSAYQKAYKILENDKTRETRFNPALVAKEAISEWTIIKEKVIPNLYPLLLRICSPIMLSYQELMQQNFSRVKSFLQLSSSDFIQPPNEVDNTMVSLSNEEQEEATEELSKKQKTPTDSILNLGDENKKTEEEKPEAPKIVLPKSVSAGLAVLEKLFPEAGWENLENFNDFYPYFQPIFKFVDGVELISSANPLQFTIILVRVMEELLYGFRTMKIIDTENFKYATETSNIINEWRLYRDELLDKKYLPYIKEYCHQLDVQPDFRFSNYGKRVMSDMGWITKQYFFPAYRSESIAFTRPLKNEGITPLFKLVVDFRKVLTGLAESLEQSIKDGRVKPTDIISGLKNPWEQYIFQIENPVSRRLNAVLGGKNSKSKTNANLIYYSLSIISVLEWWINSPESYAYLPAWQEVYRKKNPDSIAPDFNVSIRPDVKGIFIKSIHKMCASTGLTISDSELSEI